jgi:hypothetical protein
VPGLLLDLLKDLAALVGVDQLLRAERGDRLALDFVWDRWKSCGSLPMRQDQYDDRMTNRHPSWNRLMGFSPLLEASSACDAGAVIVVMEHLHLKKGL